MYPYLILCCSSPDRSSRRNWGNSFGCQVLPLASHYQRSSWQSLCWRIILPLLTSTIQVKCLNLLDVSQKFSKLTFFIIFPFPSLSYPMSPPTVRFVTRIFHPNVSRHGDVGIDSIQHNWSLALTLSKVLISIQSLLTDPYCQVNKFNCQHHSFFPFLS